MTKVSLPNMFTCNLYFILTFQFALLETVITSIEDEFPWLRKKSKRKIVFTLLLCFAFFLIGLPQCAAVSYIRHPSQICFASNTDLSDQH